MRALPYGLLLASLVLLAPLPDAHAESVDARGLPCRAFTEAQASDDPNVAANAEFLLFWLAGYHSAEAAAGALDHASVLTDGGRLAEACAPAPDRPLIEAAATVLGPAATPAGKGVTLFAEVRCASLRDLTPEQAMDLAHSLMWLLGHEARRTSAPVVDPDGIWGHMKRVGEVCRADGALTLPDALARSLNPR